MRRWVRSTRGTTSGSRAGDPEPAGCCLNRGVPWRWAATRLRDDPLAEAELSGLDLRHVRLRRAVLRDARLDGVRLDYADLSAADLRGADRSDATVLETDLCGADLRGADLRGARQYGGSAATRRGSNPGNDSYHDSGASTAHTRATTFGAPRATRAMRTHDAAGP